ncbi:dTMP kinase [Candidatus Babeliales bacterium]|nr:dTMP kinase [Candidatus Babeliales bacterium]
MPRDGYFIIIEGIDGCGKSTLARHLAHQIEQLNKAVLLTKEPGGSPLGKSLRSILQTQEEPLCPAAEFLLFAADRAQHFEHVIIPALNKGTVVISDRGADSSLAYQGYGYNLDRSMITSVNQWVMQGIEPDLVLYVKLDVATAKARLAKRNLGLTSFEKRDTLFWQQTALGFDAIFATRTNVVTLDGALDEDKLFAQAWQELEKRLR